MRTLAQYEKAVTISEPNGCHFLAYRSSQGSKTPICLALPITGCGQASPTPRTRNSSKDPDFHSVFNNLQTKPGRPSKRFRAPVHNSMSGPFFAVTSGWFGPNFVTILAPGVRVCSI